MAMSNEDRSKSALGLICDLYTSFKDMTYSDQELEIQVKSGLLQQMGLIAANTLDINERETVKNADDAKV